MEVSQLDEQRTQGEFRAGKIENVPAGQKIAAGGSAVEPCENEPRAKRRIRTLRDIAANFGGSNLTPLDICQAIIENRLANSSIRQFFSLPQEEKHYWVSSLYAALMPQGRRRRLATYFTPPYLTRYVIDVAVEVGVKLGKDRILDPASGGAAFLVPLAMRIAKDLQRSGRDSEYILRVIESTLSGIEIQPSLTKLSHILLASSLRSHLSETGRNLNITIQRSNALKLRPPDRPFGAILGNPPYGRVLRPSRGLLSRFDHVISAGYVNLYALFVEQALRWVRPGGVICLIIPMSFIGGPYFEALRKRILESSNVLRLDPIDKRGDVFLDVNYDICVLTLRKKDGRKPRISATSSLLLIDRPPIPLGQLDLPITPSGRIWALPDGTRNDRLFQRGLSTLSEYGYMVRAGYFVWNRERNRYRTGFKPRATEVPLYWAHNIRPNVPCVPHEANNNSGHIGFVNFSGHSSAIVQTDAIVLQRTSNRRQKRRLIAGLILKKTAPGNKGFVSENHTILIVPDPAKFQRMSIYQLCRLLNSEAVDARFRRVSGSVSISAKTLRQLPLPDASAVRKAFQISKTDDEAVVAAYNMSLEYGATRKFRQ